MNNPTKKIIAIIGPTASGKSELAVNIAQALNSAVISVDSRQIYKGMNLGTGKIPGQWQNINGKDTYLYKDIEHFGIDIVSAEQRYSVTEFQQYAWPIIETLQKENKIPVLCGGTAHWMDAVVKHQHFPQVEPDNDLRKQLEKLTNQELYSKLKNLDPVRASAIDQYNKRRLVRAVEIAVSIKASQPIVETSPYEVLWIGIQTPIETLGEKIKQRLIQRINNGMITEVQNLEKSGLSWQQLEDFGLEYRFASWYLQGIITNEELINRLSTAIKQYAKRQLTWWKRNPDIHWIQTSSETQSLIEAFKN